MRYGKLIVFEGTDGSGKTTQFQLLSDYFKIQKIPYATLDFPQYYKTFFGKWIGRFLKGDFGRIEDLPPYLLMFPYAADRWQAKPLIEQWLSKEKIIISNRYTGSNAYQAAKLPQKERARFTKWSFEMEYEAFKIPREDLVIFLYVPFAISQNLLDGRKNKKYLGKKQKDIHEANTTLMREVEKVYLEFCSKFPHWVKIECTKDNDILSKSAIHQLIIKALKQKQII